MDINTEPFNWTTSLPSLPANPIDLNGAGAICETKRFDSFWNTSGDRVILPAGKKYTSKTARANESALTVTNYWDKEQDLEKTTLEIKSPFMKAAIQKVIPEYATFNIDVKNIIIDGEPHCLFRYHNEIMSYGREMWENQNEEAANHIRHLILHMWETFASEIRHFNDLKLLAVSEPSLQHKHLWMLFRPGDLVYVRADEPWVFRLDKMILSGKNWVFHGIDIDYNGTKFGYSEIIECIEYYEGLKPLKELYITTFDRLPEDEKLNKREMLISRGRKFVAIHGKRHLWFEDGPGKSSGWMKTRIMADHIGWYNSNSGCQVFLRDDKKKYKPEEALESLTEEEFMICYTHVSGYSLRENKWGRFHIDDIQEITFDSTAFNDLILPKDQKAQLLSLVGVHEDDGFSFDDLIKGKGKGMTFLLYGEPGLGKTLTAESVADYCKKPLVRLDAGTLGTSPKSVEKGLRNAFRLAERWHALLLLDEADVYLEQRKSRNLTHNGVISGNAFDTAFISRIHLAIYYPPLTRLSRSKLLYNFLAQISPESAKALKLDGTLREIAKEKLNGRQIKNIVRTACALARGDSSADGNVYKRHLETSLRPMKRFNRTMERVRLNEEKQVLGIKEIVGEEQEHEDEDELDSDEEDEENGEDGSEEFEESEYEIDLTGEQNEQDELDAESEEDIDGGGEEDTESRQNKRRRLL
ncbi:hypothetical protein FAUST_7588 [Fusarium austroamericanum]|uniref:AAA+ ATPase domain-containing protein n=1 Tax=Fusarium austroamericanum TaxID=282268 RepID=A0AAN5Z7K2_FUSAU|nr:hypothetical protein FAUST_7588 [Fusarium austroamericanum]